MAHHPRGHRRERRAGFCAAPVFDDDDGVAEVLCKHVKVFVDWIGEPYYPADATDDPLLVCPSNFIRFAVEMCSALATLHGRPNLVP
jgi:hypothetical protein